jgi:hypothetical protein
MPPDSDHKDGLAQRRGQGSLLKDVFLLPLLFASKESTRPEWSRSSESGTPVDPDPKDE